MIETRTVQTSNQLISPPKKRLLPLSSILSKKNIRFIIIEQQKTHVGLQIPLVGPLSFIDQVTIHIYK